VIRASDPRPLRIALALTWLSLLGLVMLFSIVNIVRADGALWRWLIQCLPLLIFVPALLARAHRAYSGLCFVILLYFIVAVVGVMGPRANWADGVLLVLSVVLFTTATFASRWLQRAGAPTPEHSQEATEPQGTETPHNSKSS